MTPPPNLTQLTSEQKDALILALWEQVQKLSKRVEELEARLPDKFTNQVQRRNKAMPWENSMNSSRKVSGARYIGCMQPEYFSRRLVA